MKGDSILQLAEDLGTARRAVNTAIAEHGPRSPQANNQRRILRTYEAQARRVFA